LYVWAAKELQANNPLASQGAAVNVKPRLIQKYPNRRMYDTTQHRYVTLDEIRRFVLNGVDFTVLDKRDQSDITFGTLLNVLSKVHAALREPCLDRQFLLDAIRAQSAARDVVRLGAEAPTEFPVTAATEGAAH
jgi:polyhydroxyalkanoate synthesis repressor PhaR